LAAAIRTVSVGKATLRDVRAGLYEGHVTNGTLENRLKRYLKPDLLTIDDFAMKELTLKQA